MWRADHGPRFGPRFGPWKPGGTPGGNRAHHCELRFVSWGLLKSGSAVTAINDSAGFVAQRILAVIANLGAEMAQIGIATPADIDTAMTLGLNYPQGPLALAERLGPKRVHTILCQLQAITGEERYRPSQWLRRRALLGLPMATADQADFGTA